MFTSIAAGVDDIPAFFFYDPYTQIIFLTLVYKLHSLIQVGFFLSILLYINVTISRSVILT